jgi:hypothetical protein
VIKKTHTFHIKHTSETGEDYDGTFTCKKLSIMDRSRIGVRKSQLCGGMYCVRNDDGNPTGQGIDEDTDWLNFMIANLEVALVQKPVWFTWEGDNAIDDPEILKKVYKEVAEFETSFRRRDGQTAAQGSGSSSEEASAEKHQVQESGSVPTPVRGQKVQAALDA